ncbi:precorrin-2 dehydrogenase/sirohydrochlorin ferrochelatase family protein [Paludibaculum fermentans]|uniref:precorrin-2 dehydrogenase n=1 Tax=Paludibaculum fermentans TaxID=1473598 RepID=A0A7S7NXS1_PALFE|nr:bifunctional precorrin-2 dehydrogenase/sirohydrochlorin ferrochelatase [Paludibaculum fermentans]QOY91725.1 bifunctional precorrin-2 dehydrogenase/sirohydrochlorin ferrochelatase [Paludibaculum fermentans]
MAEGYPIILDVEGKKCLVLGSGREADEKSAALARAGAVLHRRAEYDSADLDSCFAVISAGPDRSRNPEIFAEAERRGILVCCVDDPPHCRFTFASVVRQGELVIAISTGGACPALAVRIREKLERELGPEYAEFLKLARRLRGRLAETVPDFQERRKLWYALVDSEILDHYRSGDEEAVNRDLASILPPDALI